MMEFIDVLARTHSLPYRLTAMSDGRRSYLIAGLVMLDEKLQPERINWAYCHELAHHLLKHAHYQPLDDAELQEQENDANKLAAELLLPEDEFAPHSQQTLSELKSIFAHASYEVIARRRLHFYSGLLTIYDNNKMTARISPDGWNQPPGLCPTEKLALDQCYRDRAEVTLRMDGLAVEATFIDEGRGVERVILFAEPEGDGM